MTALSYRTIAAMRDLVGMDLKSGSVEMYAGGTDLLPLRVKSILMPEQVIDIKSSDVPRGVQHRESGWYIGALTTLSELADHDGLAADVAMIREALNQTATKQIRNRATLAGNLLQRVRCSYYRDPDVSCWLKGGDDCPARLGRNEHHGLVDASPCVAVQPSDLASVLVALDAEVHISGPDHDKPERRMALAELLCEPTVERRRLHCLRDGEVITGLTVPHPGSSWCTYRKAMDRAVWQFALVGLAAVVSFDESAAITQARLVAAGVGAVPVRLPAAEAVLAGRQLDDELIERAARSSGVGLVPLSSNGYKVPLLGGLVTRALQSAQSDWSSAA